MDDCCAVCAEPLEWAAYGPCAHRDVCSTCDVRLRNLCDDRRCCICKTDCTSVFITKALGDYTKTVDFSSFPADAGEGKVGSYWYHEATQAFFDDVDHYKMIKAMCTFSCSVCDKEGHQNHGAKRKANFRNLEQLKDHLFHKHRLLMCSLCLEGRRVFMCEQKLYTKAQLNQHISTGDSVVDGSESERGGFMGHPMCEFCRTVLYGENELYTHMSTEHYTCHMCQRQNPGQFEYYRNYDDLEVHFRQGHYLCEDEECLGKKFIVFQSEAELKRHNALEHVGRMSRSKRNAVLQIPTSFNYRRPNEAGARRGRGRNFRRQSTPDNQFGVAIQASIETANAESRHTDRPASSCIAQQVLDDEGTILVNALIPSFESLAAGDSGPPSRYRQAMAHNHSHSSLAESSFPPLSATLGNSQQKPQQEKGRLPQNTMAACLRQRNSVKILNVAQALPAVIQTRPVTNNMPASLSSSSQTHKATARGPVLSSYGSTMHASSSSRNPSSSVGVKHSTSASVSDFPPISGGGNQVLKVEDIRTANKSLVERIHSALNHDKDIYAVFKDISKEYCEGSIGTLTYLEYVKQFGLLHLVPDMAKLCPDPLKQKELVKAYNSSFRSNGSQETFWGNGSIQVKEKKSSCSSKSATGKKLVEAESSSSKKASADDVLETVRRFQSGKDGYVAPKGKSKVSVEEALVHQVKPNIGSSAVRAQNELPSNGGGGNPSGDGGTKRGKKKTSKFLRVRLGDASASALLDPSNTGNDPVQDSTDDIQVSSARLPVGGAWRNGGGQKLFGTSKR